ncbi:unnamed protein product [Sphagnum troendelagicum]|uniref:Uncharacterized protein n=1 Tax=Sphagnum troendelagicum TaxID=128251 RepID=A0ABP0URP7_9BRYO
MHLVANGSDLAISQDPSEFQCSGRVGEGFQHIVNPVEWSARAGGYVADPVFRLNAAIKGVKAPGDATDDDVFIVSVRDVEVHAQVWEALPLLCLLVPDVLDFGVSMTHEGATFALATDA